MDAPASPSTNVRVTGAFENDIFLYYSDVLGGSELMLSEHCFENGVGNYLRII